MKVRQSRMNIIAVFDCGSSFKTRRCTCSHKIQPCAASFWLLHVVWLLLIGFWYSCIEGLSVHCVSNCATDACEGYALAVFFFFFLVVFQADFSVSCASFHSPIKFFSEDANGVSLEYFITLSSSISSSSLPGLINQSTKQPFLAARHSVPKVSHTSFVTESCHPLENGAAKDCHSSKNQHLWI